MISIISVQRNIKSPSSLPTFLRMWGQNPCWYTVEDWSLWQVAAKGSGPLVGAPWDGSKAPHVPLWPQHPPWPLMEWKKLWGAGGSNALGWKFWLVPEGGCGWQWDLGKWGLCKVISRIELLFCKELLNWDCSAWRRLLGEVIVAF